MVWRKRADGLLRIGIVAVAAAWLCACSSNAASPPVESAASSETAAAAGATASATEASGGGTPVGIDADVADNADPATPPPDITSMPRSAQWLIEQRETWAEGINTMAIGVDRFFAGDAAQAENESYLRLRAGAVWSRGGDISSDSDVKLKVDLPGSKRRWKLMFDSDPDEFSDLESQTRVTPTTDRQFTDTEQATGAVRFVLDETSRWKRDLDVGVHGSTPLDPFVRFQLRRSHRFADLWTLNFKERIYFFNQDGWGQRMTLSFDRPLSKHYFWRNRVETKFSDDDNLLESAFVISTVHVLDDWHAIDYAVGTLVANRPVSQITVYFINTTFRKRLYKDWLFFDIRPELAFKRGYESGADGRSVKHGYKAEPSLTFGIDAYVWE